MKGLLLSFLLPLTFLSSVNPIRFDEQKPLKSIDTPLATLDTENQVFDSFDNGLDSSKWYISNRVWGENSSNGYYHGGVIKENVLIDKNEGSLVIRANGGYYAKEEVSGVGTIRDGSLTGGAIISKFLVRPGRFEVKMKVAPRVGICNAFWIYNEDDDGTNHEIDFEMPGKTALNNNSYNQILCTNYVGVSGAVSKNYTSSVNVADGEYHTYTFDWYYSDSIKQINYFLDGQLIQTATNKIPFYENRIWLGAWIPNNPNFVGLPNFDQAFMEVDYVSYTPFLGQTYTEDSCYVSSDSVASSSEYPTTSTSNKTNNFFPNGDFEYVNVKSSNLDQYGMTYNGTYSFINNGVYGKSIKLTNGGLSSKLDTILPNKQYKLNLDYMNSGNVNVHFYDESNNLLDTETLTLEHQSSMKYVNDFSFTTPLNTFYAVVEVNSASSLILDNVSFVMAKDEIIEDEEETSSDSYGVNLIQNSNIPVTSYITKQTYAFDGNNSHPWVVSCFEKKSSDGLMRLGYYNETDASAATTKNASIRYYGDEDTDEISTNFKKIYQAVKTYMNGEDHFVQTVYMDYDVTSFDDIAFYFSSFGISGWQRNVILYSIDSGNSWNYLNHSYTKSSDSLNTNGIDIYEVSATSDLLSGVSYSKIRFAYASVHFSLNTQVIRMTGIVLNRYQDFKNKINSDTCNLSQRDLDILSVIHAHMSDSEILKSKNETLTNYDKTYFEAYNEIVARYENSGSNNLVLFLTNDNKSYVLLIVLSVISLSIFAFAKTYSKNKKKNVQ